MKIDNWLKIATLALGDADIPTSRLDALVLLEDCLNQDRAYLLAHPEITLTAEQLDGLADQLERRLQHEPLAYIRGHSEFYGREFIVDARVLEPRPESETLIELLKQLASTDSQIADIGTGSGALAITAQLELPLSSVVAVDIDKACLAVVQLNASKHEVDIKLIEGDLMSPFLVENCSFAPDVILANLPYVPTNYPINAAARHEPELALFGGLDGLDLYRTMFKQTASMAKQPTWLLTESLPSQHEALATIATAAGYIQQVENDFVQAFTPA